MKTPPTSSLSGPPCSIEASPLPPIEKGDSDWRTYNAIKLPNGVQCIFVHDKASRHTACSVCVGSGASADPRQLSGLAHFTEHMCFLGSTAYPGENEFKKYLSSHGGRSNASTAMSQTTYKFEILQEFAEKGIDIFSNFFISPLFTISGTSREVNAVDSENSKNMSTDGRRRLQILKALADPNHHYSKFSTGNAKTLAMDEDDNDNNIFQDEESKSGFIREALLAFHRRHYRPDNYVVVVVGPQDLKTLEEWIVPRFSKIVNQWNRRDEKEMSKAELFVHEAAKDAPNDAFVDTSSNPIPYYSPFDTKFQSNTWPVLLTTLPLQSVRKMYIYFPLPSVKGLQDQSPYYFICHLLGHEGPGSCFALLQDQDLVDVLSAGPRLSEADHSLLAISLSLTEKGEERWEDVVSTVFEYCHLLHDVVKNAKEELNEDGISVEKSSCTNESPSSSLEEVERIWDEIQRLKSLRFHQTSPGSAFALAPYLSGSVRRNGTKRCMSLGSMIHESKDTFPLESILQFLEKLVPQNCFIERSSQNAWEKLNRDKVDQADAAIFGFQQEKWYGVEYHLAPIDANLHERWNRAKKLQKNYKLHLPKKNQYIPTDLSLCPDLPEEAKSEPRIEKDIEPPNLVIHDKNFGRLWHRLDDRYCLPKGSLRLLLRNPAIQYKWDDNSWAFDAETGIKTGLILDAFEDALAQTTYDAHLAGLDWSLTKSPSGLILECSGYSQHLTDFALKVFQQFYSLDPSFLTEKHVRTNKDKSTRFFESYLKSRRADNYASYYTNLLLSSRSEGIEQSLEISRRVDLQALRDHHQYLITLASTKVECFVSGNASQRNAENFFMEIQKIINHLKTMGKHNIKLESFHHWFPGPFERALVQGEEIHLHFQSQNEEEQNGAVRMTFQSSLPGYRGVKSIEKDELVQTAALRVLSQIFKEPFFNELRTKQQLGYIVQSNYDMNFTSASLSIDYTNGIFQGSETLPINSIVLNILSRKVPPPVISERMDEFIDCFRARLCSMSESEIKDHTDALSRKLLKPIQKLQNEVDDHFGKITRYSPEVLDSNIPCDSTGQNDPVMLPWDYKIHLAAAMKALTQQDILNAWDCVIADKRRSRVVTHIYGSSFPLESSFKRIPSKFGFENRKNSIQKLTTIDDILDKRNHLKPFGINSNLASQEKGIRTFTRKHKLVFTGATMGLSFLLYALNYRNDQSKQTKK